MVEQHAAWCRQHFARMGPGCIWAVPRTGLIFRRTGNVLLWVGTIPPEPAKRMSPAKLAEAREDDYESHADHFSRAGVSINRASFIKAFASLAEAERFYLRVVS
jgi:hypothetical protein